MFIVKRKNGEWFNIADYRISHYSKEASQLEEYFCPECQERVILKMGPKRMAHFAHKKGSACPESFERESEYHINGKILLYEWFKLKGLSPMLEPYYKEIRQRPDIGLNYNGFRYAIEYQCSVIPEDLFAKRTEAYLKTGIVPIWIMAGKNIKRKGRNKLALSSFDYLFLTKTSANTWMLPAFCPITKNLMIIHHITPATVKNAFVQFSLKKLSSASLSDFFNPIISSSLTTAEWQLEMRKCKNFAGSNFMSIKNKFLQEVYSRSLIPSLLPPEIGLPVFHAPYIETGVIQWQTFLYLDVLGQKENFSMDYALSCFKKRIRRKEIKLRMLPLDQEGDAILAAKEYIWLLVKLNILKEEKNGHFKRIHPLKFAENQFQQMEMEKIFYQQLGHFF